MSWFKKAKHIYTEPTVDELIDDIMAEPTVQLEMKLNPIGFGCKNNLHSEPYTSEVTYMNLKLSLSFPERNKFDNKHRNILGEYNKASIPTILRYDIFYVSLYTYKGKNYAYGLSKDSGLVDMCGIYDMSTKEIERFLGNLNDSTFKTFSRNNLIDDLL